MKAKKAVEIFSQLNSDEEVWISYVTKDEIVERLNETEREDSNGNLIDFTGLVTDVTAKVVFDSLDENDYLWETFNNTYNDICYELAEELTQEEKEDTELWDKE